VPDTDCLSSGPMTPSRLIAAVLMAGLLLAPAGETEATSTACLRWTNVPSPAVGDTWSGLNGVAARSSTDAWAVGWSYTTTDFHQQVYAQHWDGRAWSTVATPEPPLARPLAGSVLTDVAVAGEGEAWAVGWYLKDDGYAQALTMRWGGAAWSIVPVPPSPRFGDYRLHSVAAVSSSDVWAVGFAGGQPLVLHWNGATWQASPAPILTPSPSNLYAVDARSARNVWAVGYRSTRTGRVPLALRWNGRRWSVVTRRGLNVRGELLGVATGSAGSTWGVGWRLFPRAAGDVALAVRWTGHSWSQKPMPNRKYWDNRIESVAVTPSGVAWAAGFVAYDVDKKVVPVALRWSRGRWRRARVENAGDATFLSVDLATASDGWAVGAGPSGVFTQRLRRC
jgi:hypothetical protein